MPSTVGVVASNNCSPILTIQGVNYFYFDEYGPETIFESYFKVVANGLLTTISFVAPGPYYDGGAINGGTTVAAGAEENKSCYVRYAAPLGQSTSYYPIITLTNAAGTVTKVI
jgi:hypothetical protein